MPFQKEPKICPVCHEGNEFKFIQNHRNKDGRFSLYECNYCKVHFWQPFKSPSNQWYNKSAFLDHLSQDIKKPKLQWFWHKKFLQLYKNFPKGIKILDLGCGIGEFLAELQKKGFEVWGVDFSKNAIEIAKKHFALENLYLMSFNEFFRKEDLPQFDIITFFEVIEHLDNPLEFIQNVKRLLKPTGRIVLSVPSRERMFVNLNVWDFPPFHLTRWNREAILNLFQKINFEISHIYYIGQFKSLLLTIMSKFRLGLTSKTKSILGSHPELAISIKIIHLLACLKDYIIGSIFVILISPLWIIDKIMKCTKDNMLIELILKQ